MVASVSQWPMVHRAAVERWWSSWSKGGHEDDGRVTMPALRCRRSGRRPSRLLEPAGPTRTSVRRLVTRRGRCPCRLEHRAAPSRAVTSPLRINSVRGGWSMTAAVTVSAGTTTRSAEHRAPGRCRRRRRWPTTRRGADVERPARATHAPLDVVAPDPSRKASCQARASMSPLPYGDQ